jgi:polysaccharide export outer membrane protein
MPLVRACTAEPIRGWWVDKVTRRSISTSTLVWVGVVGATLVTSGCVSLIPASGPNSVAVYTGFVSEAPYALVKLTPQTVDILAQYEPAKLAGTFRSRKGPPNIRFGIGDVVSVTIFEAAAGGLFIPTEAGVRPGNFVQLPDEIIDNNGYLTVPYAGAVRAAGRTNVEIQNDIVERIKNRAIEPQVIVALAKQNTSLITVFGEVGNPVRYPAASLGAQDRVTDAITRAGGIKNQGYQTWVMLERNGKRASIPLANLVNEPENNIFVQPGDRIYVYQEDQKFIAFGASGQQGEFPFGAWRINLASAVAKAGGLNDGQADPGSVFLYRREPRHVAELLGADVSRFKGDVVPVVFNVSFQDPSGYFLATKVQMRNGDIIFTANAEGVEISKVAALMNTVMATISNEYGLAAVVSGKTAAVPPTTPQTVTVNTTP